MNKVCSFSTIINLYKKYLVKNAPFFVKNRYLLDIIIYRETCFTKEVKDTYLHIFCLKYF
jgi:hypothetical protein